MQNWPDYIAAWLGISKVGGVVALINTKLVGRSLSHCINVADADHVILADDLAGIFETARPDLNGAPKIWMHGGHDSKASIVAALDSTHGHPLPPPEPHATTIH